MKTKRIFAGSMILLMLSVSSLAAACDLSCAFWYGRSDCHAQQTEVQDSAHGGMKMDGMPMADMAMPEVTGFNPANQETVSNPSKGMSAHAALVDMNTCDRQSCDQAQATAAQANCSALSHHGTTWRIAEVSHIFSPTTAFHDARDGLASGSPEIHSPLTVSLRI